MRKSAFFAFLLLTFAFTGTYAQTGGVKGKLKNMNGDGISGATITARQNSKEIASTTSNSSGSFTLGGLKEGTYSIVFDAKGYSTSTYRYDVEVKAGKVRDLGGNLILMVDRGSQVLVRGSVFYKDGTSVSGAKVEVERIGLDGSVHKVGTYWTNVAGEFSFRQSQGPKKFRITAVHRGASATKELAIEEANVYNLALSLDITRQ